MPPPWFFSLVPRDGIEPPQAQGFNLPLYQLSYRGVLEGTGIGRLSAFP